MNEREKKKLTKNFVFFNCLVFIHYTPVTTLAREKIFFQQKIINLGLSFIILFQGDTWTPLVILSAVVATFGFAVPAGYSLGVLNTPVKVNLDNTIIFVSVEIISSSNF